MSSNNRTAYGVGNRPPKGKFVPGKKPIGEDAAVADRPAVITEEPEKNKPKNLPKTSNSANLIGVKK
jgi:hypothetical protein